MDAARLQLALETRMRETVAGWCVTTIDAETRGVLSVTGPFGDEADAFLEALRLDEIQARDWSPGNVWCVHEVVPMWEPA